MVYWPCRDNGQRLEMDFHHWLPCQVRGCVSEESSMERKSKLVRMRISMCSGKDSMFLPVELLKRPLLTQTQKEQQQQPPFLNG